MRKVAIRTIAGLIAAAGLCYGCDYVVWRYRVGAGRNPYGTVTVQFYYAIGEKSGKTEYDFQPPRREICANSWFPHDGYAPCWYERKHTEKAIRI